MSISDLNFYLSKIFWFCAAPSTFFFLLAGVGVGLWFTAPKAERLGRLAAGIGITALAMMGFSPLSAWLLWPLEQRFPQGAVTNVAGIILLGGALNPEATQASGQFSTYEGGRLLALIALARSHPDAPIIFTGGSANVIKEGPTEADIMQIVLPTLGVGNERVIFESQSRNTIESAQFTAQILHPHRGQLWLLVTSAFHMPRATAIFRKAGFDVEPYPVEFRLAGKSSLWEAMPSVSAGLGQTDLAAHEWVGLLAAYWMGKSDSVFPPAR
jgi:uncharacterized SAM-binding protein YcdF (DUF218 family)